MPEPVAAFILEQIRRRRGWTAYRQHVLDLYAEYLDDAPLKIMTTPDNASGHLMVVRFDTKEQAGAARAALNAVGIETSVHFPVSPTYRRAHALTERLVSLPCHLYSTRAAVKRTCEVILGATR
jgi:dTDP-4-amino-4,6-dideoxygalactose transaminase